MKNGYTVPLIGTLFMLMSLYGCGDGRQGAPVAEVRESPRPVRVRRNAIYHWKTTFNLDYDEKRFLKVHSIKKMYVRYFDVDVESSPMNSASGPVPVGTTVFKSKKPSDVEIVPTVFITVKSLVTAKEDGIQELASKIYTRVCNMTDFNDLGPVREIQLDCDWTASTKDLFYALCRETVNLAHADSVMVSSTIRLHQLKMDPPPVDQGVLMVYNTGALRETGTKNSILDYDDVKSYLSGKPVRYGLPLDFAYPVYGWGVVFSYGRYRGILHRTDYSYETRYRKEEDGTYTVIKNHFLEGEELRERDLIRLEYPTAEEVRKVAELVASSIRDSTHSVILYHLDSNNLLKFTHDEISGIYSY